MLFIAFAMGVFFSNGPRWAFWSTLVILSLIESSGLILAFWRGLSG